MIRFTFCFALTLCFTTTGRTDEARDDAIIVRAIERMEGFNYNSNPQVKDAIKRHIQRSAGGPDYLQLLKRYRPEGMQEKIEQVLMGDDLSLAVEAAKVMGDLPEGPKRLRAILSSENTKDAMHIAQVLGLLGNGRSSKILSDFAASAKTPYELRRECVASLAKSYSGEEALLEIAKQKKLVPDTRLLAGALLSRARGDNIKEEAAKVLPQPALKDQKPLAPLDKLAGMKGDSAAGQKLFRGVATCANCHVIGEHGKEVGPNLSEIGSKLSREAMLGSILDPSAGISHNYENYTVLTDTGQLISGIKVSESDSEVVIRTADAIDRRIPQDEIEMLKKNEKSIMPDNLHHAFDQQGLIDIVEYMVTLKKK